VQAGKTREHREVVASTTLFVLHTPSKSLHLSPYTRVTDKQPTNIATTETTMAQPGVDCKLSAWLSENTYHHTDFTIAGLASVVRSKQLKVTVIIPAREVADSIGGVLNETVKPLVDGHVVHSVFAIDANSIDNTGAVAAANGAHVLQRAEIAPELGKSLGTYLSESILPRQDQMSFKSMSWKSRICVLMVAPQNSDADCNMCNR